MKRVEIIANRSIAADILENLEKAGVGEKYTFLPVAHGRGNRGTKLGDALWPEENCLYILYVEDDQVGKVREIIREIKEVYPREGTKAYITPAEIL